MAQKQTQAILSFLSRRKRFYLDEAVKETGLDRRKALRVLEKLCGNGFLNLLADEHIPREEARPGRPGETRDMRLSKTLAVARPKGRNAPGIKYGAFFDTCEKSPGATWRVFPDAA